MAGVGIVIDSELERLAERLNTLADMELDELLDNIGSEIEDQTKQRIEEEKTDPSGVEWEEWSQGYKKSRHDGQSLLEGEGALFESISYEVNGDEVVVGTNLVYGRTHQLGLEDTLEIKAHRRKVKSRDRKGTASGVAFVSAHNREVDIPARPFLGLSENNEDKVLAIVDEWLDDQIMGE
jgi:phage virion morphogenesis protein